MTEVLAPVGGQETLSAALRAGADAVYFGLSNFNARRNADNFNEQNIASAVKDCRIRGVKAYLTLNTLVYDREMRDALKTAELAVNVGIDGIICADLGLARQLSKLFPKVPLHASTQLSVHTKEALPLLKELGFCRVVPAREMSREELKEFLSVASALQMEVEVFVHGALCMCFSGQCLMSAFLGGRSGNRGLCAGTCRLPFRVGNDGDHALSLKDLSLIKYLPELREMGVTSFKIEGRMKPPEYIAAATAAARQALDRGTVDEKLWTELYKVFSRQGFSDGYYKGRIDKDLFGFRTRDDAALSKEVKNSIHEYYRREYGRIPLKLTLSAADGAPLSLTACDGENTVTVKDAPPQKAQKAPATEETVRENLSKLGGTPYYLKEITVRLSEGLFLPAGKLNALRREALKRLDEQRSLPPERMIGQPTFAKREKKPQKNGESGTGKLVARFRSVRQMPKYLGNLSAVILPAEEADLYKGALPLICDLPRGMSNQTLIKTLFEKAEKHASAVFCENIAAVNEAKERGLPFIAGSGLNILNSDAAAVWHGLGAAAVVLSPEISQNAAAEFYRGAPLGVTVYGRIPLMLCRTCPGLNAGGCKNCSHVLKDRMAVEFPFDCRGGYTEIFNSRPLWLADKQAELSFADFEILQFTTETADECAAVIKAYHNGKKPTGEYTRGLYKKGVL